MKDGEQDRGLGGGVILKDDLSKGATGQSEVMVCAREGEGGGERGGGVLVYSGHLSGSRRAK